MENKIEKQFVTESGFEAFVVINETTNMKKWRCGYVIIPEESSLFKMDVSSSVDLYDLDLDDPNIITKLKQQKKLYNVDVHGRITYNDFYDVKDKEYCMGYCIGFDCAHYQDTFENQTLEYCINECERLAKQLKEIEILAC